MATKKKSKVTSQGLFIKHPHLKLLLPLFIALLFAAWFMHHAKEELKEHTVVTTYPNPIITGKHIQIAN